MRDGGDDSTVGESRMEESLRSSERMRFRRGEEEPTSDADSAGRGGRAVGGPVLKKPSSSSGTRSIVKVRLDCPPAEDEPPPLAEDDIVRVRGRSEWGRSKIPVGGSPFART